MNRLAVALSPKDALEGPVQLILFVTDRCNARCAHCFNWKALNQGADVLSLEELRSLASELPGLLSLSVSGGEPFLREGLPRLVAGFATPSVFVPTNGLLPDRIEGEVREILDSSPSDLTVSLSLDGLPATHDRIRGVPGGFSRLRETYVRLAELPRLRLKVGTVLCGANLGEIPALIAFVRETMPSVDFHDFEVLRGAPPDGSLLPPTADELEALLPAIFDAWDRAAFFGAADPVRSWLARGIKRFLFRLYVETLRERRQLIPCLAGQTSLVVSEEGSVSFCELREPIGSLREASLPALWRSPRAEAIRASIARGECHCVHSCFQQKNVFLNPRVWPHLVRYLATGDFSLPS